MHLVATLAAVAGCGMYRVNQHTQQPRTVAKAKQINKFVELYRCHV